MRQIRDIMQGSLLLVAVAYIAMESYVMKVQNGAADPDRSGSVRTTSRTLTEEGKLSYELKYLLY